jgi:hypothetical protein
MRSTWEDATVTIQIVIVLAVGVFMLAVLTGVALVVLARLRRTIKTQFDTVENLLKTVQTSPAHNDPTEPSPRHGDISSG